MANEMLTITIHLDLLPGGVSPELHLKEGSSNVAVNLLVLRSKDLVDAKGIRCVIRGIRADGEDIFLTAFSGFSDSKVQVTLDSSAVSKMAGAAGTYKCTLTLLDTGSNVNRETYKNYNFLTVLPFTVIVHEKARRDS